MRNHPSHDMRFSFDASSYDEMCKNCYRTDRDPQIADICESVKVYKMSETTRETYNRLRDDEAAFFAELEADRSIDHNDIKRELERSSELVGKWNLMARYAEADLEEAQAYLDDDVIPRLSDAALSTFPAHERPTKDRISNAVKQQEEYRQAAQAVRTAKARKGLFKSGEEQFASRSFDVKSLSKQILSEDSATRFNTASTEDLKKAYAQKRSGM